MGVYTLLRVNYFKNRFELIINYFSPYNTTKQNYFKQLPPQAVHEIEVGSEVI